VNTDSSIYVAGHRGLVGSSILRKLKKQGFPNILIRTSSELDLKNQADTETFFEQFRPEYVFLAAAKVGGIVANSTYKARFIYDNLAIACNVIHASYKFGVKKLLNLGSSCIYPRSAPQPLKEEYLLTGMLEPTNEPYAIAKIAAIKLCRYYNEQYGTEFISVMPTNLYGPEDNFDLETSHVLPALVRKFHLCRLASEGNLDQIKKDEKIFGPIPQDFLDALQMHSLQKSNPEVVLWGTGSPYREFLYSDDLAEACIFLMSKFSAHEIGEFVNIGTGKDTTIKGLAGIVKEAVGSDSDIQWDTSKPDGTPRKLLDISRIKELGWQPETDIKTGIKMYYEWYREKAGVKSNLECGIKE
jgi:GDP-L-fucose synthase